MSSYSRAGYTPQPPSQPGPGPKKPVRNKGRNGRPGSRLRFSKRAKAILGLLLVLILLVLAALGVAIYMSVSVHAYDDTFVPGVFIGNVSLGGMTPQQAAEQLTGVMPPSETLPMKTPGTNVSSYACTLTLM